jgi:hypothetical protein
VFPVLGGRKVSHLRSNIEALSIRLSAEEMDEIERDGYYFEVGFPHDLLRGDNQAVRGAEDVVLTKRRGHFDYVERPGPILPPRRDDAGDEMDVATPLAEEQQRMDSSSSSTSTIQELVTSSASGSSIAELPEVERRRDSA